MACCLNTKSTVQMINKTDKYILTPFHANIAKRQNLIAMIPDTADLVNLAGRKVVEDIKETPENPAFERVIEAATQEHFEIIYRFDASKNARNPRVMLNPYYIEQVEEEKPSRGSKK